MTIALVTLGAGLLLLLVFFFFGGVFDSDGLFVFGLIFGGVTVFVAVLMAIIQPISLHYSRIDCKQFASNTGRTVQFRAWNDGYSSECYVRTGDGRWLPKGQLRDLAP